MLVTRYYSKRELSVKIKWDKKENNIYTNLRVEKDGKVISSVVESLNYSGEWTYITVDISFHMRFYILGEFLFFVNEGRHDGFDLCFFEEGEKHERSWTPSQTMWPHVAIFEENSINREYNFDRKKFKAESMLIHKGAIFFSPNPCRVFGNPPYRKDDFPWADNTAKGRWLFPHPDGSRAAYEHMRKTTIEDDFRRLLYDIPENPKLKKVFENL